MTNTTQQPQPQARPAAEFGDWFLQKALEKLSEEFWEEIYMQQKIEKKDLYRLCSWWWRFTRTDTRKLLTALAQKHEGIRFSNRGLWISENHRPARHR